MYYLNLALLLYEQKFVILRYENKVKKLTNTQYKTSYLNTQFAI